MTHVSLSFVVALAGASLALLIGLAIVVFGFVMSARGEYDTWIPKTFGTVVVVVTLGISAFGFYPYDMQYHQYRKVDGTVASIESRLLAEGKGTTQNFPVRLEDDGKVYRCDDSRCALLKPGDHISLWCIRDWQYASESGYRCRYGNER